eukprot:GHUV01031489.1.p1 GENE.GHUV01031489.1~~GHUV01031489.1.p1  ORF type:complete len:116 (+),score=30.04 GHUV01031489.1:46-393(+)
MGQKHNMDVVNNLACCPAMVPTAVAAHDPELKPHAERQLRSSAHQTNTDDCNITDSTVLNLLSHAVYVLVSSDILVFRVKRKLTQGLRCRGLMGWSSSSTSPQQKNRSDLPKANP